MTVDTNNIHTLKYVSKALGLSISSMYYYVRVGKIQTFKADYITLVDISRLSDDLKERINKFQEN